MNIIAIDSLKMNKNLKFRANEPQAPQAPVESPVANPTATMRALEMQGQNNIAFQGLNSSVLAKNAKKLGIAAAALAAVMSSPSCTKYEYEYPPAQNITINNSYNVTVNINQMEAFMEYMKGRDEQLFNMMQQWMEMWKQGQLDNAEFYENMYNLMLQNTANQEIIIDLLVQNGKTEEEAKNLIQELINEVKAGNITAAQAYEQIIAALGQIQDSLKMYINELLNYIKASDEKLFSMLSDMQKQYERNEMTEAEYNQKMYETIIANQAAIINILKQNGMNDAEAKAYLEKILSELGQIKDSLNAYINELLNYIKASDEKLFSMLSDMQKQYERNEMTEAEYNQKMLDTFVKYQEAIINILKQNGLNDAEAKAYLEKIVSQLGDIENLLEGSIKLIIDYAKASDEKLFSMLSDMQKQYERNEMTEAEYNQKMLDTFVKYQEAIINILKQNGLNDAEAKAYLEKIVSQLGDIENLLEGSIKLIIDYAKASDEKLFSMLSDMQKQYERNEITEAEYNQKMFDTLIKYQEVIINILKQNGMNEAEAKAYLEKIISQLGDINAVLTQILDQLKTMAADNAKYHEENLAAQSKADEYLSILVDQGKLNIDYAEKTARLAEEILKNTSNIVTNGNKTIEYIQMYGDKVIEEIRNSNGSGTNTENLEKMLAFYGVKLEEAIKMNADQLEAAIKTFMERYEKTSAEYNENLASKIDEVNKNLQTLIAQMGSLFNEVKTHNNLSNKYWNATLESINKFTGDVADLKAAQQLSNKYLESLNSKASLMIQRLEELAKANPGLTQEQLEEALSKYGEKAYEQYTDFAISIGLDKLADKGTAIEETLDQIKAILKKKPEYSAQLDRIIALLELNAGNSTKLEEIKQLLAEFKCNCECGKDSSENEGILGDLDNIINGN